MAGMGVIIVGYKVVIDKYEDYNELDEALEKYFTQQMYHLIETNVYDELNPQNTVKKSVLITPDIEELARVIGINLATDSSRDSDQATDQPREKTKMPKLIMAQRTYDSINIDDYALYIAYRAISIPIGEEIDMKIFKEIANMEPFPIPEKIRSVLTELHLPIIEKFAVYGDTSDVDRPYYIYI